MDGREAMAMSGPSSYYLHRGIGGPGPGPGPGPHSGLHGPLGIRPIPNPSPNLAAQSSHIGGSGGGGGASMGSSAFQLESQSSMLPHGVNAGGRSGIGQGEPVKRKRGRPRKYGPDGSVALVLSPLSTASGSGLMGVAAPASTSGSGLAAAPSQKRGRGRPPGTGRKQQLASLGEWIAGSAGMGFTPHIITIPEGEVQPLMDTGARCFHYKDNSGEVSYVLLQQEPKTEDIAAKIMSFSQQGPRAICILSANGAVSTVTLRQPATSGGTATYEGRFEILCLSGSYLLTDNGGSQSRSGGLSISLSSPDGRVMGGGVGGLLIAATPVQVIVGSFLYGGSKSKNKAKTDEQPVPEPELPVDDRQSTPASTMPNLSPLMGGWPGSRQQMDMRNAHMDIDLTRG